MSAHVIVIGSGIAGLTAALHAVKDGCRVTLVTKDVLDHANTREAQGGIAGVMFPDDRVEDHIRDTLEAGAGLCDPEAVRVLATEGPERIRELIALGVAFDRGADGSFLKGLEAAHSYPRILHAGGDATGSAIEHALVETLRASAVRVVEHAFAKELVIETGRVRGVTLLVDDERVETLAADAVVLASGGAGELYSHTTNPPVATGDGIALALRNGVRVKDLEFFQFHPTVLAVGEAFLVSEAVRGEGATLHNAAGERFVDELAPRDVVARAIAMEMERQGGVPVTLDATGLDVDLEKRFPRISAAVRARGLDWTRERIPVTPAAHYFMGGIETDLFGRTSLPGLYAVGEVACTGVHGANRLASNSLLEGAVFGARAGERIRRDLREGWAPVPSLPLHRPSFAVPSEDAPPFSRRALQELMWDDAGLIRDEAGLAHAAEVLAAWASAHREPRRELEDEDENLLTVAVAVVAAARARTESVGAHYRSDFPPAETAGILDPAKEPQTC